jgi:hypothetical protein
MKELVETLDHPLTFILFMLLALYGLAAVIASISKKMGWTGIAAFFGHP